MEAYPRAAMERAMKVQDVMLQAMAKKITVAGGGDPGDSATGMRRAGTLRERATTIAGPAAGQPSRRGSGGDGGKGVRAVREKYFDLNVQHFHEVAAEQGSN